MYDYEAIRLQILDARKTIEFMDMRFAEIVTIARPHGFFVDIPKYAMYAVEFHAFRKATDGTALVVFRSLRGDSDEYYDVPIRLFWQDDDAIDAYYMRERADADKLASAEAASINELNEANERRELARPKAKYESSN